MMDDMLGALFCASICNISVCYIGNSEMGKYGGLF